MLIRSFSPSAELRNRVGPNTRATLRSVICIAQSPCKGKDQNAHAVSNKILATPNTRKKTKIPDAATPTCSHTHMQTRKIMFSRNLANSKLRVFTPEWIEMGNNLAYVSKSRFCNTQNTGYFIFVSPNSYLLGKLDYSVPFRYIIVCRWLERSGCLMVPNTQHVLQELGLARIWGIWGSQLKCSRFWMVTMLGWEICRQSLCEQIGFALHKVKHYMR